MLQLTINVEAKDQSGLENSIREALRVIEKGNRSGLDGNDDESYDFQITGEEEEPVKVVIEKLGKKFYLKEESGGDVLGTEEGFKTKNALIILISLSSA